MENERNLRKERKPVLKNKTRIERKFTYMAREFSTLEPRKAVTRGASDEKIKIEKMLKTCENNLDDRKRSETVEKIRKDPRSEKP